MTSPRRALGTCCAGAVLATAVIVWAASRARSLPSLWRRPEPRHARPEIPPHPRLAVPGLGQLDVIPVAFPESMPHRPEQTLIDEPPALARPFITHHRPGRAGVTTAPEGNAA